MIFFRANGYIPHYFLPANKGETRRKKNIYTLFFNIQISEYKILDRFIQSYYVNWYRKLESSDTIYN